MACCEPIDETWMKVQLFTSGLRALYRTTLYQNGLLDAGEILNEMRCVFGKEVYRESFSNGGLLTDAQAEEWACFGTALASVVLPMDPIMIRQTMDVVEALLHPSDALYGDSDEPANALFAGLFDDNSAVLWAAWAVVRKWSLSPWKFDIECLLRALACNGHATAIGIATALLEDKRRPLLTLEEARRLWALCSLDDRHRKTWKAVAKLLKADDTEEREVVTGSPGQYSASVRAWRVKSYREIIDNMDHACAQRD